MQLQSRLNMSSRNSSKPPSSDGLNKPPPKSLRVAGQKPRGGQKGHPGGTLCQAAQPDKIVIHGVSDQCQHALCNAHHLRELTYLLEEQGQTWAGDMIELLTHASHLDNVNCADGRTPNYDGAKYHSQVRDLRHLYDAILAQASVANPVALSTGKRGRPKQSKATNLIARLRDYSDDVWRFMTQANVPFTNNLAEQAVRMPKVKQKVSGCFRTHKGAQTYCVMRSYAATLHKQGANIFDSLVAAFNGAPPQPTFD